VIVEPIQSEGGDNHASISFFRRLREITKRHGVLLIVDEVQTGVGATGTFWAHEKWELPPGDEPDIVTFSKKFQAAGWYFHEDKLIPNKPYRQFNTWFAPTGWSDSWGRMGDPVRALTAHAIIDEIRRSDLLNKVRETGDYLYNGLEKLSRKFPHRIRSLRGQGQGTFIAWTESSPAARDKFINKMKTFGVNIGGTGVAGIRLRPMLIFGKNHSDVFLERLEACLSSEK
jgi:4-aminobutyrate aminotransferase/(S)-3-amino-2-methylpropionate transaminase